LPSRQLNRLVVYGILVQLYSLITDNHPSSIHCQAQRNVLFDISVSCIHFGFAAVHRNLEISPFCSFHSMCSLDHPFARFFDRKIDLSTVPYQFHLPSKKHIYTIHNSILWTIISPWGSRHCGPRQSQILIQALPLDDISRHLLFNDLAIRPMISSSQGHTNSRSSSLKISWSEFHALNWPMMFTFVALMLIVLASWLLQRSTHKAKLFLTLLRICLSILFDANSSFSSKDSITRDASLLHAQLSHTRVCLFTTTMTASFCRTQKPTALWRPTTNHSQARFVWLNPRTNPLQVTSLWSDHISSACSLWAQCCQWFHHRPFVSAYPWKDGWGLPLAFANHWESISVTLAIDIDRYQLFLPSNTVMSDVLADLSDFVDCHRSETSSCWLQLSEHCISIGTELTFGVSYQHFHLLGNIAWTLHWEFCVDALRPWLDNASFRPFTFLI
jgi:hypothetical protein